MFVPERGLLYRAMTVWDEAYKLMEDKRLFLILSSLSLILSVSGATVTPQESAQLRDEVRDMFYHSFDGYMQHAFPLDELKPSSCSGEDTLGGYSLTLVDSLDMLALLGDRGRFTEAVQWLGENLRFDKNQTVSLFETNIRILGGLLSAHLIASDAATGMQLNAYNDELLTLALDLGYRLLPAFETPTGIPYGSVNLLYGVNDDENKVTSTAGGGTLTLEFGILSRLSKDPAFETLARNAVRGLWTRRSQLGLLGGHINVFSGEWTHKDAGIGTSIDSFYEYLLKAYLLLGDEEYLYIFNEAYKAVMRYLFSDPWYWEVNMNSATVVWPLFNSLQAFWPGLQVLAGDIEPAIRTHKAFFSVWKRFGFTPEGFNLATSNVQPGQRSYPLRPELIESTYWLYKATRDPMYLDVGRDIIASLQYAARCRCGYCHIADVESHMQDDHMESFFLAETVKYLWLLFDLGAGGENLVEKGPYPYVFSTEGHLFPMTPEISMPEEHCSYPGSFCPDNMTSHSVWLSSNSHSGDEDDDMPTNGTCIGEGSSVGDADQVYDVAEHSDQSSALNGQLKGVCRGLGYWRKLNFNSLAEMAATQPSEVVIRYEKQQRLLQKRLLDLVKSTVTKERGKRWEAEQKPNNSHKQEVSMPEDNLSSSSSSTETQNGEENSLQ